MRQFIDILSERQINEVEYQHRTSLWDDVSPYLNQGLFIHFGGSMKVAMKPGGFRVGGASDPVGVYCYELDWLGKSKRFADGIQYATNFPHWSIIRLKDGATGIRLSQIQLSEIDALAIRNNWPTTGLLSWPDYKERTKNEGKHPYASLFWGYVRMLGHHVRHGGFSQMAALRGLDYIWDDGTGVVMDEEPHQMVALKSSAIEIVARGEQKVPDDKRLGAHRYPFVKILKTLRGRYGGDLVWKNKIPSISFTFNDARFQLEWKTDLTSGFEVSVTYGRADERFRFKKDDFEKSSMENVMSFINSIIEKYGRFAKAKRDLFFTPHITEKEAVAGINDLLADRKGYVFKTEISNPNKLMRIGADKVIEAGSAKISYSVYCVNTQEEASYRITIRIGSSPIAQGMAGENPNSLRDSIVKQFEYHLQNVHPSVDGYSSKFFYEDDFRAFKGFVAKHSGIKAMWEAYADDITFYDSYAYKDTLGSDIARIYRWG